MTKKENKFHRKKYYLWETSGRVIQRSFFDRLYVKLLLQNKPVKNRRNFSVNMHAYVNVEFSKVHIPQIPQILPQIETFPITKTFSVNILNVQLVAQKN